MEDFFGPAISVYSRKQAIDDGFLIDVSETARETGFVFPVALTAGAWGECVEVPKGVKGQDEAGRLWVVLDLLREAIRDSSGGREIRFQLHVRNDNRAGTPPLVTLKSVSGPGDDGEPVLTIMLPDED